MEKVTKSGVKKVYEAVKAIELLTNYKPVVHISQDIVSIYPGRRMGNDKSTGLFDQPDDGKKFTSTRHALVVVGVGTTLAQVEAQLAQFPEGVIQRVVTNDINDILTDGDRWALATINPETGEPYSTIEKLKDKYETRDTDGNRFSRGQMRVDAATGVVLNELLAEEYTRNFYQRVYTEDKDFRAPVMVVQTAEAATIVS
jgi:hypothetical protein